MTETPREIAERLCNELGLQIAGRTGVYFNSRALNIAEAAILAAQATARAEGAAAVEERWAAQRARAVQIAEQLQKMAPAASPSSARTGTRKTAGMIEHRSWCRYRADPRNVCTCFDYANGHYETSPGETEHE